MALVIIVDDENNVKTLSVDSVHLEDHMTPCGECGKIVLSENVYGPDLLCGHCLDSALLEDRR